MVDAGPGNAIVIHTFLTGGWTAVVDGGPPGTPAGGMTEYQWDIAPPPASKKASARVDLLAVSHIDEDHIGGAIDLMSDTPAVSSSTVTGLTFGDVWHNSFANLTNDKCLVASTNLRARVEQTLAGTTDSNNTGAAAVVASVPQGLHLSDLIAQNGLSRNQPFAGLIKQGDVYKTSTSPRSRSPGADGTRDRSATELLEAARQPGPGTEPESGLRRRRP